MGRLMIVSKADRLDEYMEIARQFDVCFEINDFYETAVLDNSVAKEQLIEQYKAVGIPEGSTLHGAFFDIVVFSQDERIRDVSRLRMKQSMEVARELEVTGVVFHTNFNPMLSSEEYDDNVVEQTTAYLEELLKQYREQHIYLENMFDSSPRILARISERLIRYDNYGVCLDYAHSSISQTPMSDWGEGLAPYLKHVHINDNDLKRDLHLAVGTGQIDWNQFAKYYRTYFDQCSVLVENTLPETQIQSIRYLQENFVGLLRE